MNRRAACLGIMSALSCVVCRARAAPALAPMGCVFFESDDGKIRGIKFGMLDGLRPLGNEQLPLVPLFMQLDRIFKLRPSFGMYDDGGKGNAFAVDKSPIKRADGSESPDGMVAFGSTFYEQLKTGSMAAMAAVYAHEFGHLLQYKYVASEIYKIQVEDNSVARVELHADFICGYFGGVQNSVQIDYKKEIQVWEQCKGGDDRTDDQHHGTCEERANAVQEGIKIGAGGILPPAEIVKIGLDYVKKLDLKVPKSR
jgi:hypothetical protein